MVKHHSHRQYDHQEQSQSRPIIIAQMYLAAITRKSRAIILKHASTHHNPADNSNIVGNTRKNRAAVGAAETLLNLPQKTKHNSRPDHYSNHRGHLEHEENPGAHAEGVKCIAQGLGLVLLLAVSHAGVFLFFEIVIDVAPVALGIPVVIAAAVLALYQRAREGTAVEVVGVRQCA